MKEKNKNNKKIEIIRNLPSKIYMCFRLYIARTNKRHLFISPKNKANNKVSLQT